MNLTPLLAASLPIQIHTTAAIIALLAGALVAVLPKGVGPHRAIGSVAALALLVTAISSFWIFQIRHGSFSWIHLLSILTIYSVVRGIIYRRQGRIRGHKLSMLGAYLGLAVAGLFTFAPGRIMHAMFMGN